jgi:long-chain fatty acid transport protein
VKNKLTVLFLSFFLFLGETFAGGFQLNEQNARAMAMGGAFTAIADDPSAIYFNGAGLTQMSGIHFMLGTTLIAPTFSFRGVSPSITEYDAAKQTFFPTHFYATYSYNKDLAFGIGFDSPFGLASKWDPNWVGKYLAIETKLQTFAITPEVAYNLLDNLSISAGLEYSFATVTISQKAPLTPFAGDAFTTLDGKDNSAWGFNFGAMYKPTDDLSFGVSFHSQVKYQFKGTATTSGPSQLASELPNGNASADLTTPVNLAFGVSYRVIPELLLSADYQYVGWSSYDTLTVNFSSPQEVKSSPRLYDNSYILRFGAEYSLLNDLKVRAGIYFDKDPVKTEYLNPMLPDANRLGFSFGLGYKINNNLDIDAAYLFIRGSQLTVTDSHENYLQGISPFNGTYNTAANLVSLTLSYGL